MSLRCCHIFLLVFVPICIGHFAWGVRTGGWFPFSGGLRGGQHGKTAKVTLIQAADSGVSGQLFLSQSHPNGPVLVRGLINGLKKGYHGFHVHMKGQLGNNCKDSGSHFNPFMKNHGDPRIANIFVSLNKASATHPFATERHVGDLGNIFTGSNDHPTQVHIVDNVISLEDGKENNILGRAIVVHAGEDDLGRGGDESSLKTGNAGGRMACGLIEEA